MTVSVIVPVKNDAARLAVCLASLALGRPTTPIEIIVADNGSIDASPRVAAEAGARVLALPHLKVSALRNAAAREATGELLAFVDADHEPAPGWIQAAVGVMEDPHIAVAGAQYIPPQNGTWVQQMYGALRGRTAGRHDARWLGSGNMVVRRALFDRVGGFDASLEACEDVDICRRLRATGWRIVADEQLASVHHGDPATLGALFAAERWRGRDNLRVSLRGPMSLRDLPSTMAPVMTLAAMAAMVLGPVIGLLTGLAGARTAAAGAAFIVAIGLIRAMRMAARLGNWSPLTLARAFAVALVYDAARAIALITRAPHHRPQHSQ